MSALLVALALAGAAPAGCSEEEPLSDEARSRSTVLVESEFCGGTGSGSGFFISGDEVLTNRHVIDGARNITVKTIDGEVARVQDLEVSPDLDMAVLHVGTLSGEPLGLGDDPQPGDFTWAIGYPNAGPVRVTEGRVVDVVPGSRYQQPSQVIRTRAEADLGSSGGPLEDEGGLMAGLVFAIELETGWSLAIPVSEVSTGLSRLENTPLLGSC